MWPCPGKILNVSFIHQWVAPNALYLVMQAILRCSTPIGSYRRKRTTRSITSSREKHRIWSANEYTYTANGWRHHRSIVTGAWRLAYASDRHRSGANGKVTYRSMSIEVCLSKIRPCLTSLLIKHLGQFCVKCIPFLVTYRSCRRFRNKFFNPFHCKKTGTQGAKMVNG